MTLRSSAVFAALMLAAPVTSIASQTIDTRTGESELFVAGNVAVGQSFTARANQLSLSSFSFWLGGSGALNAPYSFRAYLFQLDGSTTVGSPLYQSEERTVLGSRPLTEELFAPTGSVSLAENQQYLALFTPTGISAAVRFGVPAVGSNLVDSYSDGLWVLGATRNEEGIVLSPDVFDPRTTYSPVGGAANSFDMMFVARFNGTPVPEPSSLLLLASGFAMFALTRKR